MANRIYNKQVSPKGYKMGGSVRDTRKTEQMIGASISSKREKGRTKKMGGGMMKRPMMKKGGSLKPVDPKTQKGLSKLPTEVRNKMGYMQEGGKVKDKPGKNLTFGKTFHPITELAMKNAMLASFKSGGKKGFSFGKISDEHKKIKEKFFEKGVKPSEIQKLDKEFKARIERAKTSARKTLANRPGMKKYRKTQQKAKAIDTGSEN